MPGTLPNRAGKHDSTWRNRWIRELSTQLIIHGQIKTTDAKAKELRRHVEPLITMAKKGTLADRRRAAKILYPHTVKNSKGVEVTALQYLFDELGPRFKDRNGGYTRILKVDSRRGDAAEMSVIQILEK